MTDWYNNFNIGNYFMPITIKQAPVPTPQNYRRRVVVITKAKSGIEENKKGFIQLYNKTLIADYTDNTEAVAFFDGGLNQIYLCNVDNITDANDILEEKITKYFTIALSSDFTDIEKVDLVIPENFAGGVINNSTDIETATTFAQGTNQGCSCDKNAYNIFYMVGMCLSNTRGFYNNYGVAISKVGYLQTNPADYLERRLSFIISNEDSGINRIAGLFLGGRPFTTPYILDEIKVGLQDTWIEYRASNSIVKKNLLNANLIQKELYKFLSNYIETEDNPNRPLSSADIEIDIETSDDYVLNCDVEVSKITDIIQLLTKLSEVD